ncbi:hypothetical protein ABZ366_04155, partial [Streptomyces sp. NPDC005904]|uniref:hypothetical protein n=1 Tax=Streptomyces sp. NPDC005904 TaxID=3154570 RepID=UPI0033C92442
MGERSRAGGGGPGRGGRLYGRRGRRSLRHRGQRRREGVGAGAEAEFVLRHSGHDEELVAP